MSIKNTIRKKLFSHLSDRSIEKFYKLYYRFRYPNEMEKKKSYGPLNPNRIIYIIRPRTDCTEGLMSLFMNVAKNLEYGTSRGYECVVDFKNYKTQYYNQQHPEQNAWDPFFTQPSNISLEGAYKSKNVILSGLDINWHKVKLFDKNSADYKGQHDFIFKYLDFSNAVKETVTREIEKSHIKPEKLVGLYLRGTDYTALKPTGHPIQPTAEQGIDKADEYLDLHPEVYGVFLVTEDEQVYKTVKEHYKDKCFIVSFDKFISSYDGKTFLSHENSINDLGEDSYVRGINYLVKLIILSKCNYIIGGQTMGSKAALIFAGKEKNQRNQFIFDLGFYGR